ncbi:MAG: transporter, partial [Actinobacteria bacterium]|nr:transporter [Actinomycetota bacterium]
MSLVNNRIYLDGVVVAEPTNLTQTREAMQQPGSMAWLGYLNPTPDE